MQQMVYGTDSWEMVFILEVEERYGRWVSFNHGNDKICVAVAATLFIFLIVVT